MRRLSGQPVGDYLARNVTAPHGLGIWLGAPDDVIDRAARLTTRPPDPPQPTDAARHTTRPPDPSQRADAAPADAAGAARGGTSSLLFRALYNPDTTSVPGGSNNPAVLRGGWPASGAVTSAAALASFYRHLIAGRILDPGTVRAALTPRVRGLDRVMGLRSSFGLGFMRPAVMFPTPPTGAATAFGHTGFGGSVGLGDVSRQIAMAYVPNRLASDVSAGLRAYRLVEAVYGSLS